MQRIFLSLLFLSLILCACSTGVPSPQLLPASPTPMNTPSIEPPTIPPTFEGCAYMWAYKDLPELTTQLDESIKSIDPTAKAWTTAFGEDCIYADGHADFLTRETDFYIRSTITDLTDYESFGNWIVHAMKIIDDLPDELVVGPIPGFAEFWFIKNDAEYVIVRVPIQQYQNEAAGKSGEELFRMFFTGQ